MLYKPSRVTSVGAAINHQVEDANGPPLFERPPLAQTFRVNASGELLTVVVNHFKSKSPPTDPSDPNLDPAAREDGQGQRCFNARRVRQAEALLGLVGTLQAGATDRVLVIGDLNAYGEEAPITMLTNGGLVNEIERHIASPYSFIFNGQSGYLDHALTTPSLSGRVTGVDEWHINADEPTFLDYETRFNPPELYAPTPYRSSDHDPVVIGLDL
jgi:predicted extracellular nuclease